MEIKNFVVEPYLNGVILREQTSFSGINSSSHVMFNEISGAIEICDSTPLNPNIPCDYDECGCRIHTFQWTCPSKKLHFYEIPKAASTSVRKQFNLIYNDLDRFALYLIRKSKNENNRLSISYSIDLNADFVAKALLRVSDIISSDRQFKKPSFYKIFYKNAHWSAVLPNTANRTFSSFTIVRSPIDRLISNWRMFTTQPSRRKWLEELLGKRIHKMPFNDFIEVIQQIDNHHWAPQLSYLPKDNNRVMITHILKLENLEIDWGKFSSRYRLPPQIKIKNRSRSDIKKPKIDSTIIKTIQHLYKNDFELLYPELL